MVQREVRMEETEETAGDPSWRMCLPLLVCAVCVILLGFCSAPLIDFFRAVALGMV